jgi:hypothetical protein
MAMVFNATSTQYVNDIVAISFIGKKPQYPTKNINIVHYGVKNPNCHYLVFRGDFV